VHKLVEFCCNLATTTEWDDQADLRPMEPFGTCNREASYSQFQARFDEPRGPLAAVQAEMRGAD
jgi:hypothetical protein